MKKTQRQSLLSRAINLSSTKGKLIVFMLFFSLLGGGYYVYSSYADTPKGYYWSVRNYVGVNDKYPFVFGQTGDEPVACDWDGDGFDGVGVFSSGTWKLRNSNSSGPAEISFDFGTTGDKPVCGDWDGDGKDSVGLYRPSNKTFYLKNLNANGAADIQVVYGTVAGDKPLAGDWDGDGKDSVGVYRPSNQTFYLNNTNKAGATAVTVKYGLNGDMPVVGDWDGDKKDSIGVYRPSNKWVYHNNTNKAGATSGSYNTNIAASYVFGGRWFSNDPVKKDKVGAVQEREGYNSSNQMTSCTGSGVYATANNISPIAPPAMESGIVNLSNDLKSTRLIKPFIVGSASYFYVSCAIEPSGIARVLAAKSETGGGYNKIVSMDMSGNDEKIIVQGPGTSTSILSLSSSKDGSKIAYVMSRENPVYEEDLWMANSDGSNPEKVVESPGNVSQIAWDPANGRLAYANESGIYTVLVNSGNSKSNVTGLDNKQIRSLTGHILSLDWSSANGKILFYDKGLRTMNAEGAEEMLIRPESSFTATPLWLTDGRIAFTDSSSPTVPSVSGLYVMNGDGSGVVKTDLPAFSLPQSAY